MITIPTRDLVGILADTVGFAHPKEDFPTAHGVLLTWAGDTLTAAAADITPQHAAYSRWHIDDYTGGDDEQPDMFVIWGSDGDDDMWTIYLSSADVKTIVSAFKLPAKQGGTPLTLRYVSPRNPADPAGSRLMVRRADVLPRTLEVSNMDGVGPGECRAALASAAVEAAGRDVSGVPVVVVGVSLLSLAALAKVRPFGVPYLHLTAEGLIVVRVGERFVAVTQSLRPE